MESQKNKLWIKLELLIHRFQDNPSIMHGKKLDYEGGMDIKEINRLSARDIFRVEEEDGETFLVISHPVLPDELAERWCVRSQPGGWNSVNDHPRLKPDKLQRTINHLRAWQAESTQESTPADVSKSKPTAGKDDGKMENRQQILELTRQMREEIVQGDSSIHYKFKLACETFNEVIRLGAFYGASYFPLRRKMDLEQHISSGRPVSYGMIFSRAVDWIRANPKEFSFTLPVFYKSKARDHMKEIQRGRVSRGFYEINIPAVAEVIERHCSRQSKLNEGKTLNSGDSLTPEQKTSMLALELLRHHRFDSVEQDFNGSPATGPQLAKALGWSDKSQVTRHLEKILGKNPMTVYKRMLGKPEIDELEKRLLASAELPDSPV